MIDSAFEDERTLAISKRKRANRYAVLEQDFAIGAGLGVGYKFLVLFAILRSLRQPYRGKVETV